jgi:hypothetical protein
MEDKTFNDFGGGIYINLVKNMATNYEKKPNKKIQKKTDQEELTLKKLKSMKEGEVFAEGLAEDSISGINMTNSLDMLRWIAVAGRNNDWAIYCHWEIHTVEYIKEHGDKVHNSATIRRLVPCTDEAFELYRR